MKLRPPPFTGELLEVLEKHLPRLNIDPGLARLGFRSPHPLIVGLSLQRLGFSLIPTRASNKVPLIKNWPELASSNAAQLVLWQRAFQSPNFSLVTGRLNNLVVLDIDGRQGEADLLKLQEKLGPIPPTVQCLSGRRDGGRHIYLRMVGESVDIRNQQPLSGTKIDVRGWHGHIVIPGSRHKSGSHYEWAPDCAPDEIEIAECPQAWWDFLPKKEFGAVPVARKVSGPARSQRTPKRAHDARSHTIGDGPGCGGFQDPIYKKAIKFYLLVGAHVPPDNLIAQLWTHIQNAPRDPDRSIERYRPGNGDLERIVDRARNFVAALSKEEEK